MEHKGPFRRLLLHRNPLCAPPAPPFFSSHFPSLQATDTAAGECPQLDIRPQMKTTHHRHSCEKLYFMLPSEMEWASNIYHLNQAYAFANAPR